MNRNKSVLAISKNLYDAKSFEFIVLDSCVELSHQLQKIPLVYNDLLLDSSEEVSNWRLKKVVMVVGMKVSLPISVNHISENRIIDLVKLTASQMYRTSCIIDYESQNLIPMGKFASDIRVKCDFVEYLDDQTALKTAQEAINHRFDMKDQVYPCWKVAIIGPKEMKGDGVSLTEYSNESLRNFYVLFSFHHCLGDGLSVFSFSKSFFNNLTPENLNSTTIVLHKVTITKSLPPLLDNYIYTNLVGIMPALLEMCVQQFRRHRQKSSQLKVITRQFSRINDYLNSIGRDNEFPAYLQKTENRIELRKHFPLDPIKRVTDVGESNNVISKWLGGGYILRSLSRANISDHFPFNNTYACQSKFKNLVYVGDYDPLLKLKSQAHYSLLSHFPFTQNLASDQQNVANNVILTEDIRKPRISRKPLPIIDSSLEIQLDCFNCSFDISEHFPFNSMARSYNQQFVNLCTPVTDHQTNLESIATTFSKITSHSYISNHYPTNLFFNDHDYKSNIHPKTANNVACLYQDYVRNIDITAHFPVSLISEQDVHQKFDKKIFSEKKNSMIPKTGVRWLQLDQSFSSKMLENTRFHNTSLSAVIIVAALSAVRSVFIPRAVKRNLIMPEYQSWVCTTSMRHLIPNSKLLEGSDKETDPSIREFGCYAGSVSNEKLKFNEFSELWERAQLVRKQISGQFFRSMRRLKLLNYTYRKPTLWNAIRQKVDLNELTRSYSVEVANLGSWKALENQTRSNDKIKMDWFGGTQNNSFKGARAIFSVSVISIADVLSFSVSYDMSAITEDEADLFIQQFKSVLDKMKDSNQPILVKSLQ
ncbi:hypothetical protein HDV02_002131 [Globomyces sp. JEL0801]|nr:hypothetical protein HDV02_002131 [Globomyces sp. JEL0801]